MFGGDKKAFAESIRQGKTTFYPVTVTDNSHESLLYNVSDHRDATFCILTTRDGIQIKEKVYCSTEAEFHGASAFLGEDYDYENESEETLTYPGYIVHFYIQGTGHYIVVDEKEFEDFNITLKGFFLCFNSVL